MTPLPLPSSRPTSRQDAHLPSLQLRLARARDQAVGTSSGRVTVIGTVLTLVAIVAAQADLFGQREAWANTHWTLAAVTATLATALAAREATGRARRVRAWIAVGLGLWCAGQIVWVVEIIGGVHAPDRWPDVLRAATAVPVFGALRGSIVGRLRRSDELAVYLDVIAVIGAITAVIGASFGAAAVAVGGIDGTLGIVYPLLTLGTAGAALVGGLALRVEFQPRGVYAVIAGEVLLSLAWTAWLGNPSDPIATPFISSSAIVTLGVLLIGIGGTTWTELVDRRPRYDRWARRIQVAVALAAVCVAAALMTLEGHVFDERVLPIVQVAVGATILATITRQTLLLVDRGAMLSDLERLHEKTTTISEENARLVERLQAQIDEMQRVQAQMIATSKRSAIGELASAVAHEVNNPLTGVLGYTEVLLATVPADGSPRQELEIIRGEAIRAREIIRTLLDFARPRPPERQPTNLPELIRGTLDLMRYHLERGGVTIVESYAALPEIELDPAAMRQAVLNVINNAVQAMPANGRLEITASLDGDEAVVTVRDDGSGMDAATREHAFLPFFTTRSKEQATGLGLPVSQTIVESHGGRIALESTPEQGTSVEIRLPIGSGPENA